VPLPETISVRYTEEEAGYVSVRPVMRQTFRLEELLDMILSVTGKDRARVQQILHSGTIVYHYFRYSWAGFEASNAELAAALARFPDADPSRPFATDQCTNAVLDSGGANPKQLLDLDRANASRRRIFRGKSFWARLMEIAAEEKLSYQRYSYERRADLYRLELEETTRSRIAKAANDLAPAKLRSALRVLQDVEYILFICPR
jgi:hypothetical protein